MTFLVKRIGQSPAGRARRLVLCVESLEPRCLLSLAPPGEFVLPVESLMPDLAAGKEPSSIVDALPAPRDPYDWPPPIPDIPPAEAPPDWSDEGGPIDLGGLTTPPETTSGPAGGSEARDVAALLAALSYVPAGDKSLPAAADAILATLDPAPSRGYSRTPPHTEGGLVAVERAPLQEVESPETIAADLDAWLNTPVQVQVQRGRFQAFEISTSEAPQPRASLSGISGREAPAEAQLSVESCAVESPGEVAWSPGGDSAPAEDARDSSADEGESSEQAAPAAPLAGDKRARLSLPAAALVALAYLARAARSPWSRRPAEMGKPNASPLVPEPS